MRIDERIVKVKVTAPPDGWQKYPWGCIGQLPLVDCFFDSWRGTVGFDVLPFSITTRISASSEQFLLEIDEDG